MGGAPSVQVVMVGLEGTGKTTILYRLKFGQYTSSIPTIGFNHEKIEITEGKAKGVTFTVWDIGGKDNMRPLWKSYLRSADGILFVVDSSDKESMEEARIELMKLVKTQNPHNIPTLVIANKQDLRESLPPEEVAKAVGVSELSSSHACQLLSSCAVTGEGLADAMDVMYDMIRKWKKGKGKNR
ncbi:unnamed protein product [Candidula unifasciata]|uniref:Uncharacterized protein n=1 Tax=Candidula unifasciata TaxID=100452 RepID=A0A8S3Z5J4_9EUPU|nr:unnamed protein product [Candidula unifasciata]